MWFLFFLRFSLAFRIKNKNNVVHAKISCLVNKRRVFRSGVNRVFELIGTSTLKDSLECVVTFYHSPFSFRLKTTIFDTEVKIG